MKGDIPKLSRSGHSQVTYKKLLIIFGGSGEFIEPRWHHTCCIVNKYMFVHGGIGSNLNYLKDLFVYDISN